MKMGQDKLMISLFAESGIAAFAFNSRYFGTSSVLLRQFFNGVKQREEAGDYANQWY